MEPNFYMDINQASDFGLWLPAKPRIWVPSKYSTYPNPLLISESELLAECIHHLACPPDYEVNPCWQTKVGQNLVIIRQHVCGQFIRAFLDKKFEHWIMPQDWRKEIKKQINSYAQLMGQIWRNIKRLPSSHDLPPLVFHAINLERALIFFNFIYESQDVPVTTLIKNQQTINRDLQSLENPFERSSSPETWKFIERCRQFADRNDDFRKDYQELIKARMGFVSLWRASYPKKFDQSGTCKENRGRKKKDKN